MDNTLRKVLLIEDEEFIGDLYKRQLDKAGYTTDLYYAGKEGLDAAMQKKYDLILLDIMLPDINGLQILKELQQNESTKNTKVVLLTNLAQEDIIKQGLELGAIRYLIKAQCTPSQIVNEVKLVFLE